MIKRKLKGRAPASRSFFVDRHIYERRPGGGRFVVFTRKAQLRLLWLFVFLLVVLLGATVGLVKGLSLHRLPAVELAVLRAGIRAVPAMQEPAVPDLEKRSLTTELEATRAQAKLLTQQLRESEHQRAKLNDELAALRQLAKATSTTATGLEDFQVQLAAGASKADVKVRLENLRELMLVRNERDAARGQLEAAMAKIASLEQQRGFAALSGPGGAVYEAATSPPGVDTTTLEAALAEARALLAARDRALAALQHQRDEALAQVEAGQIKAQHLQTELEHLSKEHEEPQAALMAEPPLSSNTATDYGGWDPVSFDVIRDNMRANGATVFLEYGPKSASVLPLVQSRLDETKQAPTESLLPSRLSPTLVEQEQGLGLKREDWKQLQQALATLGFHTGSNDGRPGPNTRKAIAAWQASRQQEATGYLIGLQRDLILSMGSVATKREFDSEPAVSRQNEPAEVVRLREAAEQGNGAAQNNLGWMYEWGRGVARDEAEAVRWYRRAAEQGNGAAQNNLGWMYEWGRGVARDEAEAVRWYRRAAEQGEPAAQTNLGVIYESGRGVPRDEVEAVRWYRRAAEQGDEKAKQFLARLVR